MLTIPEDIKVEVTHYRFTEDKHGYINLTHPTRLKDFREELIILPRGGKTFVELFKKDNLKNIQELIKVGEGEAWCNKLLGPDGPDNYNKKLGRNIALGRALKKYNA